MVIVRLLDANTVTANQSFTRLTSHQGVLGYGDHNCRGKRPIYWSVNFLWLVNDWNNYRICCFGHRHFSWCLILQKVIILWDGLIRYHLNTYKLTSIHAGTHLEDQEGSNLFLLKPIRLVREPDDSWLLLVVLVWGSDILFSLESDGFLKLI